jgi:WD40 repeat protein
MGLSFDGDGTLVAAAWPDEGVVRVSDATTGKIVRTFDGFDTYVVDTALSPDGRRLGLANADVDFVSVIDVRTGDLVFELPGHTAAADSVAWSPDGRWIATGSADTSVRVWDAATGALEERLVGHAGVITSVDWSPDSRRIVSGASDGTARVWELEVHPTRGTVEVEGRQVYLLSAQQTQSAVYAAFSPDGQRVITDDVGIGAVKIWDLSLQGDAEVANVRTDELAPVDVAYLPDGKIVASHGDGSVAVWNVDRPTEPVTTLGPVEGSEEPVLLIATSPLGDLVAFVRNVSPVVAVWNVQTSTLAFDFDTRGEPITSIDWSGDGRYLAVGSYDGSLHVLDADDGGRSVVAGLEPPTHSVQAVAFSPDGRTIAASTSNREQPDTNHVSIWDWQAGGSFVGSIPSA